MAAPTLPALPEPTDDPVTTDVDRLLTDAVEEAAKVLLDRAPVRTEGVGEQQWVLVDYGDVVVHVFADEIRMYYEIERLYRDVPRVDWET